MHTRLRWSFKTGLLLRTTFSEQRQVPFFSLGGGDGMECSDFQTSLNSSMHTHTRAVSRVVGKRPTTCFDGPRIDQSEEMQRTRQKKSSFPPLFFPFSERGRVNITSVGCSGLQCWESGRTSDWMKSSASSIFSLLHKDPIAPRSISLRTDMNKFRESNENLAQATAQYHCTKSSV